MRLDTLTVLTLSYLLSACAPEYNLGGRDEYNVEDGQSVEDVEEQEGQQDDETDVDDDDVEEEQPCEPSDEICDGIDNDCDGLVDEGEAFDSQDWYLDADLDGYGDANNSVTACAPPSGYVGDGTDCNDSDIDVYPNAIELCDFADNDCDGLTEAYDPDAINFIYHDDDDGDGYGAEFGDGGWGCSIYGGMPDNHTRSAGDCDDQDSGVNPDATEIVDGVDNDCDGDVD